MNRIVFFFTCIFSLLFSANELNGQAAIFAMIFGDKVASENFNISLEAGAGISSYSNVDLDNKDRLAFQFGMGANIKLSDNWYLSPTAYLFTFRSIKVLNAPTVIGSSIDVLPERSDAIVRTQHIDVPIFLHYRFNHSRFRLGLAPQISFRTGARVQYDFSDSDELYSVGVKELMEPIEFGLIGVLSYVIVDSRGGKGLTFSARYYQGFTDVFSNDFTYFTGNNTSSYFGLGVSFPFVTDEIARKNLEND